MKFFSKRLLSISLSISIIFGYTFPSFAYELDGNGNSIEEIEFQNSTDDDFSNTASVFAQVASSYRVTIPKYIVLSGITKSAQFKVTVDGDIAGYETINVLPDENFNLYSKDKNPQIANISQDNTSWTYSTLNTIANGNISAPDITAGKWQGTFNFNINMNKVAGDVIAPDHEHNWQFLEHVVIPTCTEEGSDKYICSECNSTEIRTVEANGHVNSNVMKEKEVEPTCTEKGSYDEVVYCTVCGDELSRISKTIDPLGHDYKEEIISPTHFEKGYSVFTCTRCGDSYIDKETEIIPHTYDDGIITKQPTCTETGTKLYTCTCGNTKEEIIEATGHKEGPWETTKQATCTEDGLRIKKCTVCKEIVETEVLTKLGHDYKETVIAPTCTKDGYTKHVCSRCGDTFTDKVTAKLEHNFDTGKITKTPTCASTGIKTFTCNSCGFTKTQTLAKNASNHTGGVTSITTLQATCGANGSYYDKCNGCNAVLGTYTIPATGLHTWYQYEWIIYGMDRIQDIHWKCSTCGADGGWTH